MVFPIIAAALAFANVGMKRKAALEESSELLKLYAKLDGIQHKGYSGWKAQQERGLSLAQGGYERAEARMRSVTSPGPQGGAPSDMQRHLAFLQAETAAGLGQLGAQRAASVVSKHGVLGAGEQNRGIQSLGLLGSTSEALPHVSSQGAAILEGVTKAFEAYGNAGGTFKGQKKLDPNAQQPGTSANGSWQGVEWPF